MITVLNELALNFQIAMLMFIGTIFFVVISIRIKRMLIYLPMYILLPVGSLFIFLQFISNIYRIIGNLIFLISLIFLIISFFYEYLRYFPKKSANELINKSNVLFPIFLLSPYLILIISIQIIILGLILLAIFLNFKLYLRFRRLRHISLLMLLVVALITEIATIISSIDLPGAWEFSYVANIVFAVYYLFFPFLIYFEEELNTFKENLEIEKSRANMYFELAGDIMLGLDLSGKIVLLNKQGYEIFGYKKDELINQDYFNKLIPHRIRARLRKAFNQSINEGLDFDRYYINEILTKSGEIRLIKWYNALIYDNSGNIQGILSSGVDITERKLAEEKQKQAEDQFRQIFESNPAGMHIYELKEDGKLIFRGANPAADKVLGLNHAQFIDKTIEEAFPDFIGVKIADNFSNLALDRKSIKPDQISYNKNTYEVHAFYISPTSICISFIDITERLKAEKELIELNRMKGELLRRASHELRTPLVSIIGSVDLLLNNYKSHFDEKVGYYLNIIQSGGIRFKRLIESLIDVSLLESRKIEVNKTIEDLTKIIFDSIEEVKFLANERNIKVNFTEQNSYNINLDNDKIQEVITNLLMNAIKYTPPQGRIFINIKDLSLDFIEISIKDTGIGFTDEEKLRIFKEFGKIERYGQGMLLNTEGIGLGLFICKKIVDLHGGTIIVESEGRNKGSNFIVKLPKH